VRRLILTAVAVMLLTARGQVPALAQTAPDSDADTLPDAWETAFGLDPLSAASPNGATHDPDGDGSSNRAEFLAGTHPRGRYSRRLAEGAANRFFDWQLALANPDPVDAHVLVSALLSDGTTRRLPLIIGPRTRRTVVAAELGIDGGEFGVEIDADVAVGADRVMTWQGLGSHAESSIAAPGRQWFLAEGATGGPFNLFYLLQNPSSRAATVTVRFLRPPPQPPIVRTYAVAPRSRYTIWVNEIPGLATGDVSAAIASTEDIAVERAMYLDTDVPFTAGHAASAVTAPALEWFLAEGATGGFFDEYILLANPSTSAARVQIDYLLPDGMVVPKGYDLSPESRLTIRVDEAHPWLFNAAVSARIRSLNGVPIVAERSMWWADGGWFEAHNSPGAVEAGTRWLVSAGEVGGPLGYATFVLLANTSPFAGQARVTVLLEGGGTLEQTFSIPATSRFNVDVGTLFPETAGRRFGTLVESLGADPAELVVEWSLYGTPGARPWELGANALAMNLSPALRTLADLALVRGAGTTTVETFRAVAGAPRPTFSVTNSTPAVATVTIDAATGVLQLTPGATPGSTTVTVTARVAGQPDVVDAFVLRVGIGRAVTFATPAVLDSQLFPAFADMNNDGRLELVGTLNDGTRLVPQDLRALGLGPLADLAASMTNRENRPVDVNGDGRLDLISWAYLPVTDPRSVARLFVQQANGTFVEDAAFTALGVTGFGHNIASADLDNDGDVDLFLVEYTHNHPREQFYLLLNDGQGHFIDVADAAGVANRGWPLENKGEGAQVVDFDGDGDLDLYAASHFFFNEGVTGGIPRFVDRRAALGLPLRFDEGLRFLDFDNDGRLDLLLHHPGEGPQVWRFTGTAFTLVPLQTDVYDSSYGVNACDLNGDGFEDLIVSPGNQLQTRIFLNTGSASFQENVPTTLDGVGGDVMACGDFDGDGRLDVGRRANGSLQIVRNTTSHTGLSRITLDIVDAAGAHTQYGRVAQVRPRQAPGVVYTRVVDGGSGFLAQGQYELLIGTPYTGQFDVTVRFADAVRTFVVTAGQRVRLFADGRQQIY
jgi:hypothetical protein